MYILCLLILLADFWAILELLESNREPITKLLWGVLIVGLPLFGLLIWYLLGPKKTALSAS